MKYFFVDLAVIVAVVVAARRLLSGEDGGMAPECGDADAENNANRTRSLSSLLDDASPASDVLRKVPPSAAPSNDQAAVEGENERHLRVGGIVELYGDSSYFASPAIITDVSSPTTFSIQNAVTDAQVAQVGKEYIHPYVPYAEGTRAACNVGVSEVYMAPCVVGSHVVRERSGVVIYEVSYLNEDDELTSEMLPFSRVQRRRRTSGSMMAA